MPDEWPTWVIYLSMPLVGAVIGYVTKLVAVEMMFRPLEFRGIPPVLGWQGVIPRFAPRMAAIATDLVLSRLLTTGELFERIDRRELAAHLREPIRVVIDEMVRDVMARYKPLLWASLSESARDRLIGMVQRRASGTVERLVEDLALDLDRIIDLRRVAVDALSHDPALLVHLVRRIGRHEMAFIVKTGAPFGFFLGCVQALAWAFTHNEWLVPVFGAFTGLFTDWLALQLIFRPMEPRKLLGVFRWQGMFHRRRAEVVAEYAAVLGNEVFSHTNLVRAMHTGPHAEHVFGLVTREVDRALNEHVGPIRPMIMLGLGGEGPYQELRDYIVSTAAARIHHSLDDLSQYAVKALAVQETLLAKMQDMSATEFESLLRPAFKQDEWKLVAVGAVLGFLIGEVQVHLLLT